MALTESRLPEAFPLLKSWWQGTRDLALRQTGLLAIVMVRQPEATQWFLSLIAEGALLDAKEAIKAMSIDANVSSHIYRWNFRPSGWSKTVIHLAQSGDGNGRKVEPFQLAIAVF